VDGCWTRQFQIAQRAPTTLRVRLRPASRVLRPAASADPDRVWQAAHSEITHLLTQHKVDNVTLERAEEQPQQSPGGKHLRIIPLS
jgi:phenylacetate-CoA ligase